MHRKKTRRIYAIRLSVAILVVRLQDYLSFLRAFLHLIFFFDLCIKIFWTYIFIL